MPRFDGTYSHPGKLIGRLKQNLYGSKTAGFIYFKELAKHLNEHNIFVTDADPCLFIHSHNAGQTYVAATVEDVFVSSNIAAQAYLVLNILRKRTK